MGRVTLRLPRLGETMEEARIVEWLVAPGEAYARGDILLEAETDKTVVEVPALAAGTLVARLVEAGETVSLDRPIAEVEEAGDAPRQPEGRARAPVSAESATEQAAGGAGADADGGIPRDPACADDPPGSALDAEAAPAQPSHAARATSSPDDQSSAAGAEASQPEARVRASPAARAAARREGVALAALRGTGRHGRVTAADVDAGSGSGGAPGRATIVLLHGLHDDASGWRGLPERLRAAGRRVIAPDLPGHGDDPAEPAGFEEAADLLAIRLPGGPLHLVGHSLGAALAVRLAARAEVRALTLIAPAGIGVRIAADFLDGMAAAGTPAALARALALLDGGPISAAALDDRLARHVATRGRRAGLARALGRDGIQQIDLRDALARLPCPVAAMFGTADRVLDWRAVADLPAGTPIHLVPGAGHLPHLARPDLAAALVLRRVEARDVVTRRTGAGEIA